MECNICGVKVKSNGPGENGAGNGICVGVGGITRVRMGGNGVVDEEGAGVSGAEVEGASDLLPLAFLGPLKVIVGSSRFQQFFLIYAKLMVRLRLSKDH